MSSSRIRGAGLGMTPLCALVCGPLSILSLFSAVEAVVIRAPPIVVLALSLLAVLMVSPFVLVIYIRLMVWRGLHILKEIIQELDDNRVSFRRPIRARTVLVKSIVLEGFRPGHQIGSARPEPVGECGSTRELVLGGLPYGVSVKKDVTGAALLPGIEFCGKGLKWLVLVVVPRRRSVVEGDTVLIAEGSGGERVEVRIERGSGISGEATLVGGRSAEVYLYGWLPLSPRTVRIKLARLKGEGARKRFSYSCSLGEPIFVLAYKHARLRGILGGIPKPVLAGDAVKCGITVVFRHSIFRKERIDLGLLPVKRSMEPEPVR